MNKNTVKLRVNPEENIVNQPLDEIVRNGAKKMLQKALEIKIDLFLEKYQYIPDDKGSRKVVRNERGRVFDNIFIERLWRTVKYENIYVQGYETITDVHQGLKTYFNFYDTDRLHQSLDYQTPWEVYSGIPFSPQKNPRLKLL